MRNGWSYNFALTKQLSDSVRCELSDLHGIEFYLSDFERCGLSDVPVNWFTVYMQFFSSDKNTAGSMQTGMIYGPMRKRGYYWNEV
jgi:hypothetical protein